MTPAFFLAIIVGKKHRPRRLPRKWHLCPQHLFLFLASS
jgi:hypothetical protein